MPLLTRSRLAKLRRQTDSSVRLPQGEASDKPAEKHPVASSNMSYSKATRVTARAYPVGDAHSVRSTSVTSWRELPSHERGRLKKLAQQGKGKKARTVRLATINIGTLTARHRELADLLKRRRVDIACIQETKWKGSRSRDIGDGYKLLYYGQSSNRNGVGIVVSEVLRDKINNVDRISDRLMGITIDTGKRTIRVVTAYAPQVGCSDEEKESFWEDLDNYVSSLPQDEIVVIGADLNGHVGQQRDGANKCQGNRGYGIRNEEGERILDFATAHNLVLANTYYVKKDDHLITYASGDRRTQIDFWVVRQCDLRNIKDCKVIPGENCIPEHRPLLLDMKIPVDQRRRYFGETKEHIKWWNLRNNLQAQAALRTALTPLGETPEQSWHNLTTNVHQVAKSLLGVTKPGRKRIEKETWWWNEEVQAVIREKKRAYKEWHKSRTAEDQRKYSEAKRTAKACVRKAKRAYVEALYKKLDSREGEREIYRLAKRRMTASKDIEHYYEVKNEQGKRLRRPLEITERWRTYFEKMSNIENSHPAIMPEDAVEGPVPPITEEEVLRAINRTKHGKATGPDDIPSEFWKNCGPEGASWLSKLFNQVLKAKVMPEDWSTSTTVPIWKGKGDIADCSTYRPIRLMCHTLKILERIVETRLRDIIELSSCQYGFVKGASTTDAIHAIRILAEKHREKHKELHAAFLDLEKAFDRVPHEVIWWALRKRMVPEEYVDVIKMIYRKATSHVRTAAGQSKEFAIKVGVHQGSVLSPLLFITVMDAVTRELHKPQPWNLLYADDIVLLAQSRQELELDLQKWKVQLERYGLRLNTKKTEYMELGTQLPGTIHLEEEITKTTAFKYLGSHISASGELKEEISARMNAAWLKWRSLTGVLCDKKMPLRLKSKVYRTVIRPVALYGSECWPVTKKDVQRLCVMETRMLRWTLGVTMMDHVCNDTVRTIMKVTPIHNKMLEGRLRWYGHVRRREENHVTRAVMSMDIAGKRPRGRPKMRWMDRIKEDLKELGILAEDALDRNKWRRITQKADPT